MLPRCCVPGRGQLSPASCWHERGQRWGREDVPRPLGVGGCSWVVRVGRKPGAYLVINAQE